MSKWETLKLKGVTTKIGSGATPRGGKASYQTSGIPLIRSLNIHDLRFDYSDLAFINEKQAERLKNVTVEENDVLLNITGASVARVTSVPNILVPARVNQHVSIIRADGKKLEPMFLKYCLVAGKYKTKLLRLASTGATREAITKSEIEDFEIKAPDYTTQTILSSILQSYDDLIENNERRIKILEEMTQRLYTEWFVKFKFPGHEKAIFIDSGTKFGKIPEGWEVRSAETTLKRVSAGKKYDNKTVSETGKVPVLDQGKSGVIGYHDNEPGVVASLSEPVIVFANHTCYQNLIVFPFSAIQNVLPFVPNDDRSIYWLHWATKDLIEFNDYKGHWPEFITKKFVVPEIELTQEFGNFIAPIVALRYKLECQNTGLSQMRDLLIPQLVTGKRELK